MSLNVTSFHRSLIIYNMLAIVAISVGLLVAALAAVSRHKKSATGKLRLFGSRALVALELSPEGAILVRGELWRARSNDDTWIAPRTTVQVVGLHGHLLLVKPDD